MLVRKISLVRRGLVGPVLGADGTTPATGRQGKTGEATVGQAHGKYFEAASRGAMFAAADAGAGVTLQVTITTTASATLHNPVGTGKRLAIKKLVISYFSGTMPGGSLYHGYLAPGNTLPSSGTAPTPVCTDIGNQSGAAAVGVMRTGATVVAGNVLYPFASLLGGATAASNQLPGTIIEDVDGAIVLEPGAQYQLLGVFGNTGSSPKVSVGILWEEVPIAASNG